MQHYSYDGENYHAKLMSEDELNSGLKRDEIKTNSWKQIMEMKCLPFMILMRPKLRENYTHTMTKRKKLKAKFKRP